MDSYVMTARAPAPTVTRAGTEPAARHKLFVNVPVRDLQRAVTFFEALGFHARGLRTPPFTGTSAACIPVGGDVFFVLLDIDRFAGFGSRRGGSSHGVASGMFSLSVGSREEVEAVVEKALAAGGSLATDPQDHGFMYGSSFHDPDGHYWEVFWMDPAAVEG